MKIVSPISHHIYKRIEPHVLPQEAVATRHMLSEAKIIGESVESSFFSSVIPRLIAITIPVFALADTLNFFINCLPLKQLNARDWKEAVIHYEKCVFKALQCLIFTIISVAYVAMAIIFGQAVIREWDPNQNSKTVIEHNTETLKKLRLHHPFCRGITSRNGKLQLEFNFLVKGKKTSITDEVIQDLHSILNQFEIDLNEFIKSYNTKKHIKFFNHKIQIGSKELFVFIIQDRIDVMNSVLLLKQIYPDNDELNKIYSRSVELKQKCEQVKHNALNQQTPIAEIYQAEDLIKQNLNQAIKHAFGLTDAPKAKAFDLEEIKEDLITYFGKKLVMDVLNFYHLSDARSITLNSLKALITGFQANITYEDLKYINENKNLLELLEYTNTITLDSDKKILELLNVLRKEIPLSKSSGLQQYEVQLEKDQNFLKQCRLVEYTKSREDLEEYGHPEYLSRSIVYELFTPPTKGWHWNWRDNRRSKFRINVLFASYDSKTDKDHPTIYQVESFYAKKGLCAINIHPVLTHERNIGATVFRGTYDWTSMQRDFDIVSRIRRKAFHDGPGRSSFYKSEKALINLFNNSTSKLSERCEKIEWDITGHSLGGTDAQRMTESILRINKINQLAKLRLYTFNSPMIEKDVGNNFRKSISEPTISKKLEIHHIHCKGDTIQNFGTEILGRFNCHPKYKLSFITVDVKSPAKHTTPLTTKFNYLELNTPLSDINEVKVSNTNNIQDLSANMFLNTVEPTPKSYIPLF